MGRLLVLEAELLKNLKGDGARAKAELRKYLFLKWERLENVYGLRERWKLKGKSWYY